MKVNSKLALASIAAVVSGLFLLGCGSGVGPGPSTTPTTTVPIAGAGSPFIGVTMTVTCSNGTSGSGLIGTSALPGEGSVIVSGVCTPPIRITATGAGKQRPLGAPSDGSGDVTYDPTVNLPVSNVLFAIPTTAAPVNSVTALVANQVTTAGLGSETAATLLAKKTAVATSLGVSASALDSDYRNADLAAASTKLSEIAALAAKNIAVSGTVSSTKSLGQAIADNLTTEAAKGVAITTAALYTAAAGTGGPAAAAGSLAAIDNDAGRVNNMIATYTGSAASIGNLNALIATANTAALAKPVGTRSTAELALIADITARQNQANSDAVGAAAAKMVATVVTGGGSTNADTVAKAAADNIILNASSQIAAGLPTGTTGADIAAQAKAIAETVGAAIKADSTATTKIFAAPPTVGNSNAAFALVSQANSAVSAVKATTTATFDSTTAGANALKVATAVTNITPPAGTASAGTQTAFQAALGAVASKIDPATINPTNTTSQTNIAATITSVQNKLVTSIGTPTTDGASAPLAFQAALADLGGTTTRLDFSAPPTVGTTPIALAATTTTSSTSSTLKATTTTTTTTTTAAPTTTTAAATTTTAAATTTTAAATTTTAAATTTTAAPTTTTTTAATTTTTRATTTTTLPKCDPFAPPPTPGAVATCTP